MPMDRDRKRDPHPPSANEAILSLLGVLVAEIREIKSQTCLISSIEQKLKKLEVYNMALPDVIQAAVSVEIEEGLKLQATITSLNEEIAKLKEIQANTPTPGVGQAIVSLEELATAIAAINPTPVSDAVVAEVVTNTEIETPAVVEAAPAVSTEVIQAPEVVDAAIDAIVESDTEI